jgi:hypothetical protein
LLFFTCFIVESLVLFPEVKKVIYRAASFAGVEYLETSLSYRRLSNQHIEQPYFVLCLARSLQPLLIDLNFDPRSPPGSAE